jgi:hypothetical protein
LHKIRAKTSLVCDWLAKPQMKPTKKIWRWRTLLTMELRACLCEEEHCVLTARGCDRREKRVGQDVLWEDCAQPTRRDHARDEDTVFEFADDDART